MSIARAETALQPEKTSAGESKEFLQNSLAERQAIDHAQEPISKGGWKRDLIDKAIDIYRNCSEEGWDGYDAVPVSIEALEQIYLLIISLPTWTSKPDIVPTPEGEISMEWHTMGKQVLSVYPKEEFLIYAASLGPMNMQYGRSPFQGNWPEEILLILTKYFSDAYFTKS
jgi:hypothetical protein